MATTKFDVGQDVWYLHGNNAFKAKVTGIAISRKTPVSDNITYYVGGGALPEKWVFASQEEALDSVRQKRKQELLDLQKGLQAQMDGLAKRLGEATTTLELEFGVRTSGR